MDTQMTKEEIRTRVLSMAGFETNANQAPQVFAQVNTFVEEGAERAFLDMHWAPRETTQDVTLGVDQMVVNYPTSYAGAAITAIDMWRSDLGAFQPLMRARLPTSLQDDLLAGEDPGGYEQGRDRPLYYDFKDQIYIWPRNDEARTLRITFQTNGRFENDEDIAAADGLLIVYHAASRLFAFQDRMAESQRFEADYRDRLAKLSRKQANGLVSNMESGYRARLSGCRVDPTLNWGRWPSTP